MVFTQAMKYIALLLLAALVSCTEVIDSPDIDGESQESAAPENDPVCVIDFIDENDEPIEAVRVLIVSDVLEESPVLVEPEEPASQVKVELKSEVNRISTYHFFLTDVQGREYRLVKDLYIPRNRRYEKTLAMADLWKRREIRDGLVWYNLEGLERITLRNQVVNVLEMDLDSETMKLEFLYYPEREVISEVSKQNADIIALTNASYGSGFSGSAPVDNTYIRVDGVNYKEISIGPEDGGNWCKHEAAVWYDGDRELGFISMAGDPVGAIEFYKGTTYRNLFSSNQMLVEASAKTDLSKYSRSYAASTSQDPRTVLAVTKDRKLLLITVDGRWKDKAEGMSYVQLQEFLQTYIKPWYAINMDGGGSTGMLIKDKGVVNYPCNGVSDNTFAEYEGSITERPLITYFAIRER